MMERKTQTISEKNNTEALIISKSLRFPQDDRANTNFKVHLRMHFKKSNSTLDSVKVFSVHLGGKRHWVPLIQGLAIITFCFSLL